ncbi:MAG: hypothetical protein KAR25_02945, partial [Methanosarcinales archaeon]|nr:hypothetical protein [Methanosarcinales archaeon]
MTAMHLNIKHEYKRQTIHVLIGMIVLIFPFVPLQYLVLLLLGLFFSVLMLPVSSKLFGVITSSDKAARRRPTGAVCLSGSMLILVLVAWVLTFTDYEFPIFLIGGAIAITTFGDGMATILRVTEQARYDILNNIEYPRRQYRGEQTKPESVKASLTILSVGAI